MGPGEALKEMARSTSLSAACKAGLYIACGIRQPLAYSTGGPLSWSVILLVSAGQVLSVGLQHPVVHYGSQAAVARWALQGTLGASGQKPLWPCQPASPPGLPGLAVGAQSWLRS